jgi:acyl dehydratase
MLMPRGFLRLGDEATCRGKVVVKRPSKDGDGLYLVDLDLWAENQKGEKVITGKATAALISRG